MAASTDGGWVQFVISLLALILSRSLPIAFFATAHILEHLQVISRIWMALRAVSFCGPRCVSGNNGGAITFTSAQILLKSHGLQMRGVYAATHSTQVIQLKTIGDWSYVRFIGKAMRLLPALCSAIPNDSVPADIGFPEPQPASGKRLGRNFISQPVMRRTMVGSQSDSPGIAAVRAVEMFAHLAARSILPQQIQENC